MKDGLDAPGRHAATWLFVPGDRAERFEKAAASGADCVVLDLEDAVSPESKVSARQSVHAWLGDGGRGWVRVNAVATPFHADDIAAISGCAGLMGVMVPKAEDPRDLAQVRRLLPPGVGIVALVESAAGVLAAPAIAASGHVDRLAFGSIDFALDIGAAESDESLLMARSTLVVASRAAGLPGPLDGVTTVTDDPHVVASTASQARGLGFTGKLCIHPRQVEAINQAFVPRPDEVAWAASVIEAVTQREASGEHAAAFRLDGTMIDRPVVARAHSILARAPHHADPAR